MKTYNIHGTDILCGGLMDTEFVAETLNNFNNVDNPQYNEMKNFIKYSADCKVLLDVGASYGVFSFVFCEDKSKKAYAFDGSIATHFVARQAIDINEFTNVHLFRTLVGSADGLISTSQTSEQVLVANGGMMDVLVSLDTFCSMMDVIPDAIKIDVEGYEYHVLRGAEKVIEQNRPVLFMEIHPLYLTNYGSYLQDILEFSQKHNYRVIDANDEVVEDFEKYLRGLIENNVVTDRTVWLPN